MFNKFICTVGLEQDLDYVMLLVLLICNMLAIKGAILISTSRGRQMAGFMSVYGHCDVLGLACKQPAIILASHPLRIT